MAILQGFADASGNETNVTEKVLTVNGCLSTPERWQRFDRDWQDYLRAEHFKPDPVSGRYVFHTAPFWSGHCKLMPTNPSKAAKDRIYWNLIGLILKHTEYRFGYGIWLDHYRQFDQDFPGARIFLKQAGTYASRLCFTWNSVWAEERGFDAGISYTFDRGDEFWGQMFDEYRNERRKQTFPDELTVSGLADGNKAEHSPLQAADIIAWESRKYFKGLSEAHLSESLKPKPVRREMNRLAADGLDKIDIRLYRYEEFQSELIETIQEGLENRGKLDTYVGAGKAFPTIEDYTRTMLAVAQQDEDHKKQTLHDAWIAKKHARRNATTR